MRRGIAASVAVFGLLLLPAFLIGNSHAQNNGAHSSGTSSGGLGSRATTSTAIGSGSLGHNSTAPSAAAHFHSTVPGPIGPRHDRDDDRHRHHPHYYPYYGAIYAYPYPVSVQSDSDVNADDDADYQGGPTVFDRRGAGADSYVPPVDDPPPAHPAQDDSANPVAEAPPTPTVLVFKDGRTLEVGNYAIVGQTLYDLTPGHPRKIALATLNLDATQKQNDDRGVSFRVPTLPQAN
jgi:hypothetical protein